MVAWQAGQSAAQAEVVQDGEAAARELRDRWLPAQAELEESLCDDSAGLRRFEELLADAELGDGPLLDELPGRCLRRH